jgi:hypothetical protein
MVWGFLDKYFARSKIPYQRAKKVHHIPMKNRLKLLFCQVGSKSRPSRHDSCISDTSPPGPELGRDESREHVRFSPGTNIPVVRNESLKPGCAAPWAAHNEDQILTLVMSRPIQLPKPPSDTPRNQRKVAWETFFRKDSLFLPRELPWIPYFFHCCSGRPPDLDLLHPSQVLPPASRFSSSYETWR